MLWLKRFEVEIPFVLTGVETADITRFLAVGASAYVHKYDIYADLIEAVASALAGRRFVSRSVPQEACLLPHERPINSRK